MNIPKNIEADGVHAQSLTHLNPVFPIRARDARIVKFGGLDHKGLAIEFKSLLGGDERACLMALRHRGGGQGEQKSRRRYH